MQILKNALLFTVYLSNHLTNVIVDIEPKSFTTCCFPVDGTIEIPRWLDEIVVIQLADQGCVKFGDIIHQSMTRCLHARPIFHHLGFIIIISELN